MIYFIQSETTGNIKVGCTSQLSIRLQQLQAEHGKIRLLGLIEGGRPFEKALHMAFDQYLVPGMGREWFYSVPAIRNYIKRYSMRPTITRVKRYTDPPLPSCNQDGINIHLYDLIMNKRKERGFEQYSLRDLERDTDIPVRVLYDLAANIATSFEGSHMDKLGAFFNCGVGDLIEYDRSAEK